MDPPLRNTGIPVVGDQPWGTHFCHFYETKDDLLDTLVPYFRAGLDGGELCVWIVSEPLTRDDAWAALRQAVPDLDRSVSEHRVEMLLARDWYLRGGRFDVGGILAAWDVKLAEGLSRGHTGIRVTGNTAWLAKEDWGAVCDYEEQLNQAIAGKQMTALCTYPLLTSSGAEVLDVVRTHQLAVAKRRGSWEALEMPEVVERTRPLDAAHEEPRRTEAELARVARLATIGKLTASLAHELKQPLAAIVTNAGASLRWLGREPPDLERANEAARRILRDAARATDVIDGARAFVAKSGVRRPVPLDMAQVVAEALVLVHSEASSQRVFVRDVHADGLPPVLGIRVELQQVILNLMVNAIEAMTEVADRPRELLVRTSREELAPGVGIRVAVSDTGIGFANDTVERLFEAFYTTKAEGLGLGLSISRSIVEAHGGRLWASLNPEYGATFGFVLPAIAA